LLRDYNRALVLEHPRKRHVFFASLQAQAELRFASGAGDTYIYLTSETSVELINFEF